MSRSCGRCDIPAAAVPFAVLVLCIALTSGAARSGRTRPRSSAARSVAQILAAAKRGAGDGNRTQKQNASFITKFDDLLAKRQFACEWRAKSRTAL